jgi:hypothetical protein
MLRALKLYGPIWTMCIIDAWIMALIVVLVKPLLNILPVKPKVLILIAMYIAIL